MQKFLLFLSGIIISTALLAQVPQGISHQAVMRDTDNMPIVNSPVGLQVSILQGAHDGEAVYVETHTAISNQNGLVTYIIGEGAEVTGIFEDIDWSDGPFWLETKADPSGGTNYTITGLTKFLTVPYALYAETIVGIDELLTRIEDLEEAINDNEANDIVYGDGVMDVDGNDYVTVIIGDQEWMAENLRVSKYKNGDAIPSGLSDTAWENASGGAYAIYDHNNWDAEGIDSPVEMLEAYGMLYNWHAVNDSRGLCPEGWHVPSEAEWAQLNDYVAAQGYPDHWDEPDGVGNALKSCRQIDSPLGGQCNTTEHPSWWSHDDHHGFDAFGFSALPAGVRTWIGTFSGLGMAGVWWSATDEDDNNARSKSLSHGNSYLFGESIFKNNGHSVRCIRSDK